MTGIRATWQAPDPAALVAAVGPVPDRPGGRLLVVAGSDDRLDLDRSGDTSAPQSGVIPGLAAIGIASVDAERTTAELRRALELGPGAVANPVHDPRLGGRGALLAGPEGVALVVLEPDTEGLLAAFLARRGEGPCAAWLTGIGMDTDGSALMTALGPARVLYAGDRWGPFLLGLVGDPVGRSGATIRG